MKHLKLYENFEDNLVEVATNSCYWQWEYDSEWRNAKLSLDEKSNALYLDVTATHIKSGLGKGQRTVTLVSEEVGTLAKPNLLRIRELLTRCNYSSDVRFKQKWTDKDGNQLALGEILRNYNNRYNKLVNLNKVAKQRYKEERPPISADDIKISPYKNGYVIYGLGTIPIKEDIKNLLGGWFSKFLTNPTNGERFAGWTIMKRMLDSAKELTGVQEITDWEITENFNSPEDTFELKNDILNSFSDFDLVKIFPKIYEDFYNIIIEDSDLDYVKKEDPDGLQFDFAEALQVYIWDYNEDSIDIRFLQSWLTLKEFRMGAGKRGYEDLEEYGKMIYDTLEKEFETVFWNLLSKNL
jgi:hypothetical protein